MDQILFAKIVSRQVLGAMTAFANLLDTHARNLPLALRLADAPCNPLGSNDDRQRRNENIPKLSAPHSINAAPPQKSARGGFRAPITSPRSHELRSAQRIN